MYPNPNSIVTTLSLSAWMSLHLRPTTSLCWLTSWFQNSPQDPISATWRMWRNYLVARTNRTCWHLAGSMYDKHTTHDTLHTVDTHVCRVSSCLTGNSTQGSSNSRMVINSPNIGIHHDSWGMWSRPHCHSCDGAEIGRKRQSSHFAPLNTDNIMLKTKVLRGSGVWLCSGFSIHYSFSLPFI